MAEVNEVLEPYQHKNVVGGGYNALRGEFKPFESLGPDETAIIYAKALRRVGGYLGLPIGERQILALGVLKMWSLLHNQKGGGIARIVNWSGYTRNWKAKIYSGIDDCIRLGLMENKPMTKGQRLSITIQGDRVMETLVMMYERVKEEMREQYQKSRL